VDESLRLTTHRISETAYVCTLTGELDEATVESARATFAGIEESGGRHVVADLLGVTAVDAAGLSMLLSIARRLRFADGELRLVADDPRVVRLLEVTGIARQFRLERTLAGAVDDLVGRIVA